MALAMSLGAVMLLVFVTVGVRSDDDRETQLLKQINDYRSGIGVPPLSYNQGAACLADKLVDRFEHQACDNITEAQTSDGLEPNFPDYPKMLSDCHLQQQNTSAGQILVDCIPAALLSSAAATASQNFTRSQEYQGFINSSDYSSVGIASEDLWFVLVLATQKSDGSFAQTASSAGGDGGFSGGVTTLLVALLLCLFNTIR